MAAYISNRLSTARSLTSCFVFGPTLCQTGSSCLRTMESKERKYAFSTLKSSRSSYKGIQIFQYFVEIISSVENSSTRREKDRLEGK